MAMPIPPVQTGTAGSDEATPGADGGRDGVPIESPTPRDPRGMSGRTDGGAIPLPAPHHRGPDRSDDDVRHVAQGANPAITDRPAGHCAESGPGRWLPLREAVREIGSLESLYRLARDGTLRSREDDHGNIQVWVADRDCVAGDPAQQRGVPLAAATAIPSGVQTSELAAQLGALLAPLAESHERSLRLARENGALSERVPALERELKAAWESTASHQQALDAMQQRLEALLEAHITVTELLRSPSQDGDREQAPAAGSALWPWLLVVSVCVTTAVIIVWLMERGHVLGA